MPKRKNKNKKPMVLGISIILGTLKKRRKKKNGK
tara:strand:+ start:53 stop:154 length:102 start_codon:yes stop_codon:yes gene_type:complete